MHVTEERTCVNVDAWQIKVGEFADDFAHRSEHPLELEDLTPHPEDPPDLFGIEEGREDVFLEFQNPVLDRLHYWKVAIDHKVYDAVQYIVWAQRQKLWRPFEVFP
ncbi:hypothetical protein GCM10010924_45920 [Rhizobium wenxiniae]|nr:hypothetical protein GCM10010924_45920 [Rhizobium wenxiniae]